MELWTAFLLGLVGSLHCAGMCGPLALALPATGNTRASFLLGRAAYNSGRVLTYCGLGAVFGLAGQTLALAGFQRWLSLTAGAAILVGLFASSRLSFNTPLVRAVTALKSALGTLLRQRTFASTFALGLLNGLLPCGLVYTACAGAIVAGGFVAGLEYMAAFGLGTVPMLLAIGLAGHTLQFALRFKLQRLVPISVALVAVLLILRGLSLGIPYLSPDLAAGPGQCTGCH
jgi:hypothetical protein